MAKEKKYSFSMLKFLSKNKYRELLDKFEEKKGREPSREERIVLYRRAKNQVKGSIKRTAVFAALGISIVGGATTAGHLLTDSSEKGKVSQEETAENTYISKSDNFRESLKIDVDNNSVTIKDETETEKEIENENHEIIEGILDNYNSMYETSLTKDDIGVFQDIHTWLYKDSEGDYIVDYKQQTQGELIESGDNGTVSDIYALVDRQNKTVIGAIGKVNGEFVNIHDKVIQVNRQEYYESDKTIDLTLNEDGTKKSQEEIASVHGAIAQRFNEIINDNER